MGLFSKVSKVVKKAGSQISRGVQDMGQQFSANVNDLPAAAAQIGTLSAMPTQMMASGLSATMTAMGPVLGQATQLMQQNPLLANALGAATGLPLGGLFGGGGSAGGVESSGGLFTPVAPVQQAAERIPVWVWIAAGAAVLVGAVLIFRKKA